MQLSRNLHLCCVIAIALLVPAALSCMCMWEHEQTAYCRGANAMEFRVESRSIVHFFHGREVAKPDGKRKLFSIRYYKYKVTDLTIYQVSSDLKEFLYVYSDYDMSCGQTLEEGATYAVIGGYFRDHGYRINTCTHVVKLDNLNDFTKSSVRLNMEYLYKEGCAACKVSWCERFPGPECYMSRMSWTTQRAANVCDVGEFHGSNRPFENVCVPYDDKSKSSTCHWFNEGFLPAGDLDATEDGSAMDYQEYSGMYESTK